MTSAGMTVTLAVREDEGAWIAELSFANGGAAPFPLYLPKLPEDGELTSNVFVIMVGDERVSYRGPYLKRRAPVAEDFLMLAPGEEVRREASLNKAYDLPDAPGQRRCRYEAYHGDVTLFGDIWELRSNEVVF